MLGTLMTATDYDIEHFGETALLLRFGNTMDVQTSTRTCAAAAALFALPGIEETTPGYATTLVRFNPLHWADSHELRRAITRCLQKLETPATAETMPCITLPVCYGGHAGPDLEAVAQHTGLKPEEVVRRHCQATYQVAMLGFAPGFAYLLGMDEALATPRLDDPRIKVAAGSVGIAGGQTGIYPSELPGGWNLIGRTPRCLFNFEHNPPALLQAGAQVRFDPIGVEQFQRLAGEAP
ncbi:MAG: 5-oxoprolinase subunit PxpB [Sinobacteraceae bacterium]|nr:5-oxoprolinase subunit PxpB [Nevskiaceae bacterium]